MRSRRNRQARRGTALYITVLSTALIVSLLGLTGLTIVRIERQQMSVSSNRDAARMNANSAVELALRVIANDPNWRTTYTNGVETTPQSLAVNATGTLSWILEDTDGSLTDADTNLRLKGVGRVGNTVQVSSVAIEPVVKIPDSLQCSIYSVGNMTLPNCTTIGGPFASGATLNVTGDVVGDVEGNPVFVTGSVSGTVTDPGPSRLMPPQTVFDTYKAMATTIPYTSIPPHVSNPNQRDFDGPILSPFDNPYGSPNSEGVYYIQVPGGWTLTVNGLRIAGTLVVELGSGATLETGRSILWDPPPGKNYPNLIVKSDWSAEVQLQHSNALLKEIGSKNYNPPHLPYQGISDSDTRDKYDPRMEGLFHLIGSGLDLTTNGSTTSTGAFLVEGTVQLSGGASFTADANLFSNPPMGYVSPTGDMRAIPGSWIWDAAP